MFVDCPHCYTRVLPSTSGECPACGGSVDDSEPPDYVQLELHEGVVIPNVCVDCGDPTTRHVPVSRSRRVGGEPLFARIIVGILRPFSLLSKQVSGQTDDVRVELPQCKRCSAEGKPEPRHIDFQNYRMTFVVHRVFRDALRDANADE